MIYDNKDGTDNVISKFADSEQIVLKEITSQIGSFKEKYLNLKMNIYILNMILIGLDNPKWKKDSDYLIPIIDSLNINISLTITNIIQQGKKPDDLTVTRLINLIRSNEKVFFNFLNFKYKYNLDFKVYNHLLQDVCNEFDDVINLDSSIAKKYRNKKIAHLTKATFNDEFMKNMILVQKRIYIGLTEVFKSAVAIMVKYPLVAEPITSNSDKELLRVANKLLKKIGIFRYAKRKISSELLQELGFQKNKHISIFYSDGTVINS